ncbi:hypothetical protein SAMN02799630_01458 [Paenibacillus sp. UNCCL117]|uniref:hypothetical protein n=1 Tax=unclassified Paenibacillus TaxID=185978 RepID=UPI000886E9EE|nr:MULTISPECIES: hypothetical protein [unclassified Paenibacillus]SDC77750.1 hypothetical protein SAMN04488602_103437 [Paenibacillus sp. cl123]SFW25893.1 hypothetical protein SAMN02799630_01458 [Paenibacillus sp. UNCCL117]
MKDWRWTMQQQSPDANEEDQQAEEKLDWGEQEYGTHRYHVRRLVEDSIALLPLPEKAVVLGAGNHGDVDLPGMAKYFQQVTVLDTEDNMLEEWLEAGGGAVRNRVRSLSRVDYTCLDQISFYEKFEELLLSEASAAEIAAFIRDAGFQVHGHEAVPHLKKSFSYVVSSGVHTQLFYPDALLQFHSYMGRYAETDVRQILEALAYLRNSLVTDYNKLLLSLLKPAGRLAVWTDVIVLDAEKSWIAEELYENKTDAERTSFLFEAFGKYGMEAAVLGLKDLYDKIKPDQQLFRSWIGQADSGKRYLSVGLSGQARG